MSKVNMCDTCGYTTRDTDEMKTVKVPREMLPETIPGRNATVDLDVCSDCQEPFREMLERFQTERMSGMIPDQP